MHRAHGETVGAVHLFWERPDAFGLDMRASVARLAEHAGLAIANRRLLAALQGMASTDPRTGLANTRAFDQMLEDVLTAPGITDRISVSIGIASAPHQAHDRISLLRVADEALYRAKQAGRNRVVYAGVEADTDAARQDLTNDVNPSPMGPGATPSRRRERTRVAP